MVTIMLTHKTGSYNLYQEYYVYDIDSLISYIGGYLGLFLGYSFLSIYFIVMKYCTRWYNFIKN